MRRTSLILWMLTLALGMTRSGGADPIIRLKFASDFSVAINDGRIAGISRTAIDPRNQRNRAALGKVYGTTEVTNKLRDTAVSTNTTQVNGLVSATGSSADLNAEILGAWSYAYPTDPNVTNLLLELELFFPQVAALPSSGINTMSFALIDNADNVKAWTFNSTALVPNFQFFTFNLSDGAGAGGSTGFFQDSGFQLANVDILQVGYRGVLGGTFPQTPNLTTALWTGTRQFFVTPEPRVMILLAFGMLGWMAQWRRSVAARRRA